MIPELSAFRVVHLIGPFVVPVDIPANNITRNEATENHNKGEIRKFFFTMQVINDAIKSKYMPYAIKPE